MFLTSAKALKAASVMLLCLSAASNAFAQKQGKDACHVYVVDIAKSNHAFETVPRTDNEDADEKALSVGQTIFPEFRPTIGEEELTTKHYSFPGSKLVITASVFYRPFTLERGAAVCDSWSVGLRAHPDCSAHVSRRSH